MNKLKAAFIAAGNDYNAALERTACDEELLTELMHMFLADENFRLMRASMEAGETEQAFRAAHSLKGSCGMLGMTKLYSGMVKITDELRRGDIDGARRVYPEVLKAHKDLVSLLEKYL